MIRTLETRLCYNCGKPLPPDADIQRRYCSHACQQSAYKARKKKAFLEQRKAELLGIDIVEPPSLPVITDEELASYFLDLQAATCGILDAAEYGSERLRPLCYRVGDGVRSVLLKEGVLNDQR
ncbi:MAG: hypothetical protein HGA54_01645 [Actinobacteria bacterium]|nr:hypothetical protein [Actinomycetota bacterium]